jgi:hypothetical protein
LVADARNALDMFGEPPMLDDVHLVYRPIRVGLEKRFRLAEGASAERAHRTVLEDDRERLGEEDVEPVFRDKLFHEINLSPDPTMRTVRIQKKAAW